MEKSFNFKYVIVGGGIAGVSCAEMLSQLCPDEDVLLLTASPLIKAVTNFRKVTKTLEEFDVEERPMHRLEDKCPNVVVRHEIVLVLDSKLKVLRTSSGSEYHYEYLCLCTGGSPKVIAPDSPYVLGIRDTETVKVFQERLKDARRIIVTGNGGIATELVCEVESCEIIWAIKDKSIISTFIDPGAAKFFLPMLDDTKKQEGIKRRTKYKIDEVSTFTAPIYKQETLGGALGPDWHEGFQMTGSQERSHSVHVEYSVEVAALLSYEEITKAGLVAEQFSTPNTEMWPVYVKLTNNKVIGCDFIVSATGVTPNIHPFTDGNNFSVNEEDGGFNVNEKMQTSVPSVYAAGDVCHANWVKSPFWLQMRLWSQARQMGSYAAQCMVAQDRSEDITLDFCFEVFAHITRFFNYKVVLLGKYNGQRLEEGQELLIRMTKGMEFIKVVLKDGHMHGAILIGDTDMEETFENLILNQMDLSTFKDELLNPNIDIDDFFD